MEEVYGIGGFISDLPGIRGRIKDSPDDFIVEEIPLEMQRSEFGKYLVIKVRLREWDTNKFLMYLSRKLGISRKRITFAGTKDKQAITTQYFCINSQQNMDSVNIGDAEILDSFRTDRMLRLGDLLGNRFSIRIVLESAEKWSSDTVCRIYEDVSCKGGFPNFYGPQRFGSIRPNTHTIGKLLIEGEYESAVRKYIYDPLYDSEEYRTNFDKYNDPVRSLKEFPANLKYERSLLGYISEHGTMEGAFSNLPKNLAMLFVHAYQSYLFNRMISARLKKMGDLSVPIDGDFVSPLDDLFNPVSEPVKVTRFNIDKLTLMAKQNKIRPLVQLFGFKSEFMQGDAGEIEHAVLDSEGIQPEDFRINKHPELSSSGTKRITSFLPVNLVSAESPELSFSLGRGIYATSLTREFLKKF